MMDILPVIYLGYMFISLYMLSLFLLLYIWNRKTIFAFPIAKKDYNVSILVPAFNEEKTIKDTLEHIFAIEYEKIIEIIVINDKSTDNTLQIIKSLKKNHPKLKIIDNEVNLGKAGSLNKALRIAKGELIAVVDADSYPAPESIGRMVGFFDDEKVGAVTCPIIARNREKFVEKLQAIEYRVITVTRKLLDYVDGIYVTPGPLALYRKKALLDIQGFDEKNLTEDIEATWHLVYNGWMRRMCLSTSVTSTVPSKWKTWYKQRRRWNVGGLQCIYKYKRAIFRHGMLGYFIIPLFITSTFLGLLGLSIFFYLIVRRIISSYLFTKYSIDVGVPLLTFDELHITPSILNYLGIALFVFGAIFTLLVLSLLKERILRRQNILNILFYLIVYLTVYPFIMIGAIWHVIKRKKIWR